MQFLVLVILSLSGLAQAELPEKIWVHEGSEENEERVNFGTLSQDRNNVILEYDSHPSRILSHEQVAIIQRMTEADERELATITDLEGNKRLVMVNRRQNSIPTFRLEIHGDKIVPALWVNNHELHPVEPDWRTFSRWQRIRKIEQIEAFDSFQLDTTKEVVVLYDRHNLVPGFLTTEHTLTLTDQPAIDAHRFVPTQFLPPGKTGTAIIGELDAPIFATISEPSRRLLDRLSEQDITSLGMDKATLESASSLLYGNEDLSSKKLTQFHSDFSDIPLMDPSSKAHNLVQERSQRTVSLTGNREDVIAQLRQANRLEKKARDAKRKRSCGDLFENLTVAEKAKFVRALMKKRRK